MMNQASSQVQQRDVINSSAVHTSVHLLTGADVLIVFCPNQNIEELTIYLSGQRNPVLFNHSLNEYPLFNATLAWYNVTKMKESQKEELISSMAFADKITPLSDYLEQKNGYTSVHLLNDEYFLRSMGFPIITNSSRLFVKRMFDILLSSLLLFFTAPIMLLFALLIKLESKGGVIYSQTRMGLCNKRFDVYKFRSMFIDAEAHGAKWASKDDPRVTRIGAFMRKTRIDELPQLVNVLLGDMSFIGPRPERPVFVSLLEEHVPFYDFRHVVKPGLTGWAQVCYPYGASIEDAIWKHKYDLFYIKNHSFWFDMKIVMMTIKVVLFGMGR